MARDVVTPSPRHAHACAGEDVIPPANGNGIRHATWPPELTVEKLEQLGRHRFLTVKERFFLRTRVEDGCVVWTAGDDPARAMFSVRARGLTFTARRVAA